MKAGAGLWAREWLAGGEPGWVGQALKAEVLAWQMGVLLLELVLSQVHMSPLSGGPKTLFSSQVSEHVLGSRG